MTHKRKIGKEVPVRKERALGQKLVSVPMAQEFIAHINVAVKKLNYGDRSKLIRDAIVEKPNREGIDTPKSLAAAPVRSGKVAISRPKR